VAELLRTTAPRRALTVDERDTLLELIALVSPDATPADPAVVRLRAYLRDLDIPSWVRTGVTYLGLNVEEGLGQARRLAGLRDWGADPALPCDCAGCHRRERLGVYHTAEEYKRLGLSCARWAGA
jgi:hypothetical protein